MLSAATAWTWAVKMKLIAGTFPRDGLSYPKSREKLPFQTREEIERRIAGGGLSAADEAELWESLYLKMDEVDKMLDHVKGRARHPFIYPMFYFAAHTGARRSEILRSKVVDVDLQSKSVLISERKRVRGKITTRRVPRSPLLLSVLKDWIARHPGGPFLFCHDPVVTRSRTRSLHR